MSAKATPKKKTRKLDPTAVKAAKDLRKRIARAVQAPGKNGGKFSAERIARAVHELENDWRALASDAIQALYEFATATKREEMPTLYIRDEGIKRYWALRRRFDNLTGQLELFR